VSQPAGVLTDTARVFVALLFVQQPPYLLSPPLLDASSVQQTSVSVPENATVGTVIANCPRIRSRCPHHLHDCGSSSFCAVPPHTALVVNATSGVLTVAATGVLTGRTVRRSHCCSNLSDTVRSTCASNVDFMFLSSARCVLQSLAGWQVPVSVTINILDLPDATITQLRLAPGGEAAGLGVSCHRPRPRPVPR